MVGAQAVNHKQTRNRPPVERTRAGRRASEARRSGSDVRGDRGRSVCFGEEYQFFTYRARLGILLAESV